MLCWILGVSYLNAQESEVDLVLNEYIRTKEAQQKKELSMSEFRYEPGALKFPSFVGYQRKEQYLYYFGESPIPSLELVVLAIDSGKIHYDIELLYNFKGELIFCRENQNNPDFKFTELRIFFKEEKLLRFYEGNAIITSSLLFHQEKLKFIQATAKSLYDKFTGYARFLKMKP